MILDIRDLENLGIVGRIGYGNFEIRKDSYAPAIWTGMVGQKVYIQTYLEPVEIEIININLEHGIVYHKMDELGPYYDVGDEITWKP